MDIGTAFLVSVLIGQWIILWALWRASMSLNEMISDIVIIPNHQEPPSVLRANAFDLKLIFI